MNVLVRNALFAVIGILVYLSPLVTRLQAGVQRDDQLSNSEIKNIIIMIPDGTSLAGLTLARWYGACDAETGIIDTKKALALDELVSGLVRTYWSNGQIIGAITDSAPAAAAFACGIKTKAGYIGMTADSVPVANLLEASRLIGKSTGIVATCNVQHATPANFSAHINNRGRYDIIGEQQANTGIDVVLGGGFKFLEEPYRKDGKNILEEIKALGYKYITTSAEMKSASSGKLWGMFAPDSMAYEIDRVELAPSEPSLAEMTAKAIDLLSENEKGFFLMVEGSKPDWMAHANEPVGLISEILAFDSAVAVALDYAKASQNTMLLIMSDHGTGGISIGNTGTRGSYANDPVEKFIAPLKRAKLSGTGIVSKFNADRTNIVDVMKQFFGIEDLTEAEIDKISNAPVESMQNTVGPIISKRANIGWTTTGHTGEDVILFSYLPKNGRVNGVIDNTDIAMMCAKAWGIDLGAVTRDLFNPAEVAFKEVGARVEIDNSLPTGAKMTVSKGADVLVIFENKNYVLLNNEKVVVDSIAIHQDGVFYVSKRVIGLL